jgi:hypothetical protein
MTYCETANGAEVFATGAFALACSSREPHVSRLIEDLISLTER